MEIVYKKTIVDHLDEVIESATKRNKTIEVVYLNDLEFTEYRKFRGWGLDEEYKGISVKYKGELSN